MLNCSLFILTKSFWTMKFHRKASFESKIRFSTTSTCFLFSRFAELDITSKDSVMALKALIEREHNATLHSLINNAGMAYKQAATEPFSQQAQVLKCSHLSYLLVNLSG